MRHKTDTQSSLPEGLKLIKAKNGRQIVGTEKVLKIYEVLRAKKPVEFAKLDVAFDRWLNFHELTPHQYKEEGRHKVGDKSVRLSAFKGGGLRFYGTMVNVKGVETFISSSIAKKQSAKARMSTLQLAAERVAGYV